MQPEAIKTQRILIVDANGKPRICLDATYGLRLLGEDGRARGGLGFLTTGQPALTFFHGPVPRVDLRLDEEGNPDFTLVGNRQLEVAELCIRAWDKEDAEKRREAKQKSPRRKTTKKAA